MPSSAYQTFNDVFSRGYSLIDESEDINQLFNDDKGTPQTFNGNHRISDTARAGVVIVISAMDHYFTSKFAENFVSFIKKNGPTKDLLKLMQDAEIDVEACLSLLGMQRPYRRLRQKIDSYGHLWIWGGASRLALEGKKQCFSLNFSGLGRWRTPRGGQVLGSALVGFVGGPGVFGSF